MLSLNAFFEYLNAKAPIKYSHKLIEQGDYDNSGVLVKNHDQVKKVLFSLDLSKEVLKRAKSLGVDTIVSHHPAIYAPIKALNGEDDSAELIRLSIRQNLNVVSMHLNLDVSDGGIDDSFTKALGGEKYKILFPLEEGIGYGKVFEIKGLTLSEFIKKAKQELGANRVVKYGKANTKLSFGASFCGGGASYVQKYLNMGNVKADVIVTSDCPHHVIKQVVDCGKCLVLFSHYATENYGFYRYAQEIKNQTANKIECYFYADKRFI